MIDGGGRWCKPFFVEDPNKHGSLLRASSRIGQEANKNKILCRLCSAAISFSACSYTTASKHVQMHDVRHENMDVVLALANKAYDDKKPFPMKEWKEQLESTTGAQKVFAYMRQSPYDSGGQMWRELCSAIAK